MAENLQKLFGAIRAVEWHKDKATSNRRKHGIDFDEAIGVLYGPLLLRRSDRNKEERWLAIGEKRTARHCYRVYVAWRHTPDHLRTPRARA